MSVVRAREARVGQREGLNCSGVSQNERLRDSVERSESDDKEQSWEGIDSSELCCRD